MSSPWTSQTAKATPVGADRCLLVDSVGPGDNKIFTLSNLLTNFIESNITISPSNVSSGDYDTITGIGPQNQILDMGGNNITGIRNLIIDEPTAGNPVHDIDLVGQSISVNARIGKIDWQANPGPGTFVQLEALVEDLTITEEDGGLLVSLKTAGSVVPWIHLNDDGNNKIQFFKELDMGSNGISNIGDLTFTALSSTDEWDITAEVAAGDDTTTNPMIKLIVERDDGDPVSSRPLLAIENGTTVANNLLIIEADNSWKFKSNTHLKDIDKISEHGFSNTTVGENFIEIAAGNRIVWDHTSGTAGNFIDSTDSTLKFGVADTLIGEFTTEELFLNGNDLTGVKQIHFTANSTNTNLDANNDNLLLNSNAPAFIKLRPGGTDHYDFKATHIDMVNGATQLRGLTSIRSIGNVEIINILNEADTEIKGLFSVDEETVTVTSNAITATTSFHKLAGFGGFADTLETINGGVDGTILVLRADTDTETITIVETGNIRLSSTDFALDNSHDTITLIRGGSNWLEISRSDNDA